MLILVTLIKILALLPKDKRRNKLAMRIWYFFLVLFLIVQSEDIYVQWVHDWSCKLSFKEFHTECSLGKNGITTNKHEGDGKTPVGSFPLRRIFYRHDRIIAPQVQINISVDATLPSYGWVDESNDPLYNQFVLLPYVSSHENLFLDSNVYDLLAVIGYNDDPIVPNAGSAIFFHVRSADGGPTAGCVSIALEPLRYVLEHLDNNTRIVIS